VHDRVSGQAEAVGRVRPGSAGRRNQLAPVLALHRSAGNGAVAQLAGGSGALGALLQREIRKDPPGGWVTEGARATAAAHHRIAQAERRLKDLERIAEDLIADELGLSLRPDPLEPGTVPAPESKKWTRPLEERLREAAAGDDPKKAAEAARLLRERRVNKEWINKRLREIAAGGGGNAEIARGLLGELREADKEHGAAKRVLRPKQPGAGAANTPRTSNYEAGGALGRLRASSRRPPGKSRQPPGRSRQPPRRSRRPSAPRSPRRPWRRSRVLAS
jgi:hypothetical protein